MPFTKRAIGTEHMKVWSVIGLLEILRENTAYYLSKYSTSVNCVKIYYKHWICKEKYIVNNY
jgi:hypothetical protein